MLPGLKSKILLPKMGMVNTIPVVIYFFLMLTLTKGEFELVGTSGVVTVKEGERNLLLECSVTNPGPDVEFQWTFDGHLVTGDMRRRRVDTNLELTRVLRRYDTGIFRCIATNISSGFSMTSQPIRINVIWLSESALVALYVPKNEKRIRTGQEVILECQVEGSLEIRFVWFKNGERVDKDGVESKTHGKRIRLDPATVDDNGSYKCEASSDAGVVESEYFHLVILDDEVPELIIPPESQVWPVGSIVKIDCVFGRQAPVQWMFEGANLVRNSSRTSLLSNGSLIIGHLSPEVAGLYKCFTDEVSVLKPVQFYSASVRVAYMELLKPDSLLPSPLPGTHQLGFRPNATVEIYCAKPQGDPRPRLWWEGPTGQRIENLSSKFTHIRDEDTLVIPKMSEEDTGQYRCLSENVAASSSVVLKLVLTKQPRFITQPEGSVREEGESITFRCSFDGSPWPLTRIQWMHNHQQIHHAHHHHPHRIRNVEKNATLVISSVKPEDRGYYACQLTTQGYPPITSRQTILNVIERLKFVSTPVDRRLELGSTYKIPCKAQGTPPPTINWFKIGQSNSGWPKHIEEENGVLTLKKVQKEDEGEYICFAANAQGTINITIHIQVVASPTFTVTPENPTEVTEGDSLRMDCAADGDPLPTIKWDKDADTPFIDSQRFSVLENGSLFIKEVTREDHNHRFGCTAGNSGGFRREEVQLIVKSNEEYISAEKSGVMTRTVWITLSVAASYMLLVIGLMLWCRYRQLKRKQAYLADIRGEIGETELKDGIQTLNGIAPKTVNNHGPESVKSDGETGKSTHSSNVGPRGGSTPVSVASHRSQASHQSKRSTGTPPYEDITGERKDLQFVMLLGHGIFGEVFLAKGKVNDAERLLMVKALQTKEDWVLAEFKQEIDLFQKLDHENVTRLVRLCREMDPHYMVMEYSDWGDLKQFLLASRNDHPRTPKPSPLTSTQIIKVLTQLALGMDHLANLRFVHKDLATRNCLISSGFRVQVGNPALSKDTYANEYFSYRNKLVPLRWLSPEALFEDEYSTKSDVWAFGCVIWEVCNQAMIPWSHLRQSEQVVKCLEIKERRWMDVENIPELIRPLLFECGDYCPRKRPTFSAILNSLNKFES